MEKQFFFNIIIFCTIVSQGICVLSEENDQPSDILVRKKRIIQHSREEITITSIAQVPYIVNIIKNTELVCGGSILSSTIILTAAHCVIQSAMYEIFSGSHLLRHGKVHNIREKFIYRYYNPISYKNNLALLTIFQPIEFGINLNKPIRLYRGYREPNSRGILSGWGSIEHRTGIRPVFSMRLRTVSLPIISLMECRWAYHGHDNVSVHEICTLERTEPRRSGFGDAGGPLVIDDRLVGVLSWTKVIPNVNCPDVYVDLNQDIYADWISNFLASNDVTAVTNVSSTEK